MRWKRVLIVGIALFGLVLLPLAALAYYLLHLKGASVNWAALDPQHMDLNAFLASLGIDVSNLSLDGLWDQVANASERSNSTGSPGGVAGGSGTAGGGSTGGRPPDPVEGEVDKFWERVKEQADRAADKVWEEIRDALSMKPLPPDSSSGKK
jgi:hypothetical protein